MDAPCSTQSRMGQQERAYFMVKRRLNFEEVSRLGVNFEQFRITFVQLFFLYFLYIFIVAFQYVGVTVALIQDRHSFGRKEAP
jgi:hypothetical protein